LQQLFHHFFIALAFEARRTIFDSLLLSLLIATLFSGAYWTFIGHVAIFTTTVTGHLKNFISFWIITVPPLPIIDYNIPWGNLFDPIIIFYDVL
jgi:hypothetical protein